MKRYTESLEKVDSAKLADHAIAIKKELAELKKGMRMGDVQNYKLYALKRKELARVYTRMSAENKGKER